VTDRIRAQFAEARETLDAFMADESNFTRISEAGTLLTRAITEGRKIIACGNGGSMCDAMHFAEELAGRFRGDRHALPAIAISDPAFLSCTANDYGYDEVFARFVRGLGQHGDALLAISTSGNSTNVIKAIEAARDKGMKVVALTGKDGGRIAGLCDVEIRAPKSEFADRAQEIHIKVIHCLIDFIENKLRA
jgi:D-sedoheptulose 7-phosphate isomerase